MVITPICRSARSRDRQGDADAGLRRRVCGLADLAVEGRNGVGVDDDAAVSVVGIIRRQPLGGETDDVEGADKVDHDDLVEARERGYVAFAADHAPRPAHARAVDRDLNRAELARCIESGADLLLVSHFGADEPRSRAQFGRYARTVLGVPIEEHDGRPAVDQSSRHYRPSPDAPSVVAATPPASFKFRPPSAAAGRRAGHHIRMEPQVIKNFHRDLK
jgi:hypothetical protein